MHEIDVKTDWEEFKLYKEMSSLIIYTQKSHENIQKTHVCKFENFACGGIRFLILAKNDFNKCVSDGLLVPQNLDTVLLIVYIMV